jgi:sigma-B regulation protein RsbU (phosphoserine phosphatase)
MDQMGSLASRSEQLLDLFQQILDNTSAVIYVKDVDFRYVLVNQQFEQLFLLSREEITGQNDFDLFPLDLAKVFRRNDEYVLTSGNVLQCEEIAPHDDGPHTYVSVKFPLRDEFGHVVAMAGISTDITDRVQARQELDLLRHQYEMLLGSVGDGICGLDRDGRVSFVNPAMERLLGAPACELLGRCRKSFVLAPTRVGQECPVTKVLNGGDTQQVAEASFLREDGSVLPVEYVAAPLREGDLTVGAVITFRDVRSRIELLRAEQEMQTARVVQMALYPKSDPVLAGFEISGVTHPSSLTSGDYYDYVPMADGTLAVIVGDVSGHGLGPALEMVETRASLRAILSYERDLSTALARLNKVLVDDLPAGMFVTLFAVSLDPRSRTVTYASAGHQANILFRSDEIVRLDSTGTVLGILDDAAYPVPPEIPLQSGDLIVLATDGIMEQASMGPLPGTFGDLFGWSRTMESVRRNRHRSAPEILQQLCRDVRGFAQNSPQKDDVTAVIIKVL